MHGFACVFPPHFLQITPRPTRRKRVSATALKPPCKAGGRGGESTARKGGAIKFFSGLMNDNQTREGMSFTEFYQVIIAMRLLLKRCFVLKLLLCV
ncbi:hypothetical protein DP286_19960 [Escherichia coli]|nr:hypothetical protein [Escherichia coli]